jgi:hypothetical protein
MSAVCARLRDVDRHFDGGLSASAEHDLRQHLPTCTACTERYRRHLLLSRLDQRAPSAKERLARGLGWSSPRPAALGWAGGLVAAGLALFLLVPQLLPEGFRARGFGSSAETVKLMAWRTPPGGEPEPVRKHVSASDELAFAYVNQSDKAWLMIFAVDEHRHVYWYYPAWTRAEDDPGAVAAVRSGAVQELPEAISHPYDGAALTLYAAFMDTPHHVKEMEQRIQTATDPAALTVPGTQLVSLHLEVAR